MKKDATSGMLLIIIGFSAAILAVLLHINIQCDAGYTTVDATREFANVNQQLESIKANQELLKKRQAVAMNKLGIDLVDPTTRP